MFLIATTVQGREFYLRGHVRKLKCRIFSSDSSLAWVVSRDEAMRIAGQINGCYTVYID